MWNWNTQPRTHAQRKFVELIYNRTGKYANWDPPSEIRVCVIRSLHFHLLHIDDGQVGSYGKIDAKTGNLIVEGSIYDDSFRENLVHAGIDIEKGEHLAEDCPDETDFMACSKNVKKLEVNLESTA
jgi:hypothetical protein